MQRSITGHTNPFYKLLYLANNNECRTYECLFSNSFVLNIFVFLFMLRPTDVTLRSFDYFAIDAFHASKVETRKPDQLNSFQLKCIPVI